MFLKIKNSVLGTPDKDSWPDVKNLPYFKDTFPIWVPKNFEEILPSLDTHGINLLSKMLCYDPNKRITAKQALLHVNFIFLKILALFQKFKKLDFSNIIRLPIDHI
jgi:serine/threonine protein kinase